MHIYFQRKNFKMIKFCNVRGSSILHFTLFFDVRIELNKKQFNVKRRRNVNSRNEKSRFVWIIFKIHYSDRSLTGHLYSPA